jgi:hypothetical protein
MTKAPFSANAETGRGDEQEASPPPAPVAWQWRMFFTDDDPGWSGWQMADPDNLDIHERRARERPWLYEVRPLYAAPNVSEPDATEREAVAEARRPDVNQCDGCLRGLPIVKGLHRGTYPNGGWDVMSCTADQYTTPRAAEGASAPPLTDERIGAIWCSVAEEQDDWVTWDVVTAFARAIEAALSPPKKEGM